MLITNALLATFGQENRLIEDGALYIKDDRVAAIGTTSALTNKYPDAEVLDARGQLLMPGNICAHTHFYGAFARGLAIPGDAPRGLPRFWVNCGGRWTARCATWMSNTALWCAWSMPFATAPPR